VKAFMLQPARFDQLFRYNTGLWQTNDSKNRASIVSRCKSGRNVVYWNIVHDTRTELNWSGVHATAGGLNSHAPPTLSQRRRRGSAVLECVGVRTQRQMWSADPRGKMDMIRYDTRCYFNVRSNADMNRLNLPHGWKIKSEKVQKGAVFFVYVIFWEQSGVENGAMPTTEPIYSDIFQNAPFRSQIFKIFFASGGKGALTSRNQNPADVPAWVWSL